MWEIRSHPKNPLKEDNNTAKLNHGKKVFKMIFITDNESTKVLEPGKQAFNFPSPFISTQCSAISGSSLTPITFMRREHRNAQSPVAEMQRNNVVLADKLGGNK